MRAIEAENDKLSNVLPKTYNRLEDSLLRELLKNFNSIDLDQIEGDAFGKIYEYFLGRFAMSEGQKGGEFFTPTSLVKLVRLCNMNLAVHGLEGEIKQGNTYYEDIHRSLGKFDFVMANPPFNVDKVDKDRMEGDSRILRSGDA